MKAEFNEQGALVISAENNTERVALKSWYASYEDGDKSSVLAFEWDEYQLISMKSATL